MEQNKTGKYLKYAIGEIVLVMVGILLALQVNNWNEMRKERAKEYGYLGRLQEDLSSDLQQYNLNVDFYNQVFDFGNLALSYADGDDLSTTSNWEVLVAFFHASQIWPIIPTSSTHEELKSSGELSLIQSVDLRNSLSYYHGGGLVRYNGTVGIQPPYRKMVRGLIPTKVQNYMWDNCHVTLNDAQILKVCDPYFAEEKSKLIIDELIKNSTLLEELRYYMSGIKVGMTTIIEQQKLCKNMLNEIGKLQSK
jgi:hypothetical protein